MKIAEYNEMMAYLTRPEPEVLPQPKPQELLDIQEDVRIQRQEDTMDKARPFLMDESVDFIRRENFSEGERPVDIARRKIPFTEETFKKIDQLLKDPKIKTYSDLGRALGLNIPEPTGVRGKKGPGTPLSKRSGLIKAYEKSRGEIPADRFKLGTAYARGQKKVEDVLKLQADGMSTNAIAQKLKMDRRNVRTIFQKFRPDAIKDPTPKADDPTTTIKTRASARRQKREQEAFKKVGEKTANQTKKVIDRIKDKNADILKMSDAEILNDPKIKYSMNIDATGLKIGEPIKFNKYADLSDKEFVKKVKEKAKNKLFYTPEHISEVAKEKLNTAFPNNIVNAPGRMTSQIGLIKTYLRNNPDGEFAKQADEVLSKTGMQFKIGGTTFGVKENIVFDSKTNKSNIVENYFQDTKPITAGQKKLTALQELASRTGAGVDPSLLMKAGFEEFVKPTGKFAGQVARGVGTAADLAISAGKGGTGLAVGALLEADPIITGMSEGKDFGQTARDTFVGSAIDLIPGVNLGSLNEDLIKLADTEEQRIAIQNLIDYQKDYDRFNKDFRALKSYNQLNQVELEELGFTASDLVDIENKLAKRFKDIQTRAPKVYNPEVFSLARELATKEAMKRKENLETGIAGKIFGDRMAKDPNFIENQIQQIMAASTGAEGATDSYTDNYRFLPQEQLTSDELDKRFDMEGGIMAANGGRIGYSSGSDGTALAIEESLEAFQRYLKAGGKLSYKDFIALGNEGVSKFFNTGGRVGFADGPIDPKRRTFMKIMAGIASLPIFSKFIGKSEVAKPVVKLAGTTTKMPEWFPDFVNKMMFSTGGKKIDADLMEYTTPELPGVKMFRNDDGQIIVEGKNAYGEPYEILYRPPGYELVDETTGKAVKTPGEFEASDTRFRQTGPELDDVDVDYDTVKDIDDIVGGDATQLEGFAKGTGETKYTKGQKAVDEADARSQYSGQERADFDQGPEIDPTDYYYED